MNWKKLREKFLISKITKSKNILIPVLFIIIILGSWITLWIMTSNQQKSELITVTTDIGQQYSQNLELNLIARIKIIELFGNNWVTVTNETFLYDQARFNRTVPNYFNISSGFLAMNWIDNNGTIRWVYPESNNAVINRSIIYLASGEFNLGFDHARTYLEIGLSQATPLYQGGYGFSLYMPLIYNDNVTGYLNGVFQLNILNDEILDNLPLIKEYNVEIQENNQSIYHHGENLTSKTEYLFHQEISFYGKNWSIIIAPKASAIDKVSLWGNWYFLLFGMIFSSLASYLVWSLMQQTQKIKEIYGEKEKIEMNLAQSHKLESLGTLAGGVAHDFNNILMGIQGQFELLQLDLFDSNAHLQKELNEMELHENCEMIQGQIDRARDIIRQILEFSRQSDIKFAAVNLNSVLENVIKIFSESTDKRIIIENSFTNPTVQLYADFTKFQQILLNVLLNARDAMPNGGKINIVIEQIPKTSFRISEIAASNPRKEILEKFDDESEILIKIRDNGTGIPPEILSQIFDPFFTTKKMGKGTGLGLAITYRIVKSFYGDISISSAVGEGTTISMIFPLLNAKYAMEMIPLIEKIKPQFDRTRFAQKKIFIFEDEHAIAQTLVKYIQILGGEGKYEVNPIYGLQYLKKVTNSFALIIIDINMPEMNGIDVYRNIKTIFPTQKMLFITGYAEYKIPTDDPLVLGVLLKPFTFEQFQDMLANI